MNEQTDVVIVDATGHEHVFPAGMDPKKAASIVRAKSAGVQSGAMRNTASGPTIGPRQSGTRRDVRSPGQQTWDNAIAEVDADRRAKGQAADETFGVNQLKSGVSQMRDGQMLPGAVDVAGGALRLGAALAPGPVTKIVGAPLSLIGRKMAPYVGPGMTKLGSAIVRHGTGVGTGALLGAASGAYKGGVDEALKQGAIGAAGTATVGYGLKGLGRLITPSTAAEIQAQTQDDMERMLSKGGRPMPWKDTGGTLTGPGGLPLPPAAPEGRLVPGSGKQFDLASILDDAASDMRRPMKVELPPPSDGGGFTTPGGLIGKPLQARLANRGGTLRPATTAKSPLESVLDNVLTQGRRPSGATLQSPAIPRAGQVPGGGHPDGGDFTVPPKMRVYSASPNDVAPNPAMPPAPTPRMKFPTDRNISGVIKDIESGRRLVLTTEEQRIPAIRQAWEKAQARIQGMTHAARPAQATRQEREAVIDIEHGLRSALLSSMRQR